MELINSRYLLDLEVSHVGHMALLVVQSDPVPRPVPEYIVVDVREVVVAPVIP